MDQNIYSMPIVVFSLAEKFNEISTKGRARIFYKGKNRNATYISEDFASKLITTLPYTPVKGIWDEEKADFTDHGVLRTQGKIYGVVLAEPNFAWEDHEDEDGVVRTYGCADVLVYTEIYPEAKYILGKALSMELHPRKSRGEWKMIDGSRCFEFYDGAFSGLQALGDDVTPCFEGAQFFSLYKDLQELYNKIYEYNLTIGGKSVMSKLNFRLSDSEKFDIIWQAINPNYTEEGEWAINACVCEVYDGYALCYDYEAQEYFRQCYEKTDDAVVIGERVKCFVMDVSEEEYGALKALRTMNGETFAKVDEAFNTLQSDNDAHNSTIAENQITIENLNNSLSGVNEELNTMRGELQTANDSLNNLNTELSDAQAELQSLRNYKCEIEKAEKEAVIAKYAAKLDEEVIANYTAAIDNYTVTDLTKDLSYELVKATPSIFSLEEGEPVIPKNVPVTGIEAILDKYK